MQPETAIGRFAPSPTGPLHFGSLLAAMASYCDIRQRDGNWLLRIDDIDGPRSAPGSAESIQKTLHAYGFKWHGDTRWQSHSHGRYKEALCSLIRRNLVFACDCSRKSLGKLRVYPGHCREYQLGVSEQDPLLDVHDKALRLRLRGQVDFNDQILGRHSVNLETDVGDAIIWRRDKLVSYALACAVDDANDVTDVVRGADLLSSTPLQIAIMRYLSLPIPRYAHIPVALDMNGDKLSKHSSAEAIDHMPTVETLHRAWSTLGQQNISAASVDAFWSNAITQWNLHRVPKTGSISA